MGTPVVLCESAESLIVFQSLSKMLSNHYPKQSDPLSSWQKYVDESIRNLKCSVKDLCHEFVSNDANFKCDHEGHLTMIGLHRMVGRYEHLNLLMIPNTVKKIKMERTNLKTISEWADLRGKSLKQMRIYGSEISNFKLNLDGLQGALDHLPLKHLSVERRSVSEYFGLQSLSSSEIALPRVAEWVTNSTLLSLRIEARNNKRRNICFNRDGTWRHYNFQSARPMPCLCAQIN